MTCCSEAKALRLEGVIILMGEAIILVGEVVILVGGEATRLEGFSIVPGTTKNGWQKWLGGGGFAHFCKQTADSGVEIQHRAVSRSRTTPHVEFREISPGDRLDGGKTNSTGDGFVKLTLTCVSTWIIGYPCPVWWWSSIGSMGSECWLRPP